MVDCIDYMDNKFVKNESLLEGPIVKTLVRLAMPLMGISFVEMTYGLVDTMWLGRLSTESVAAVGGISIFIWLAYAIVLIAKTGISVGMSQAYGRGDEAEARRVLASGIQANILLCLLVGGIYFFGRHEIISFYGLDPKVQTMAEDYLAIIAVGMGFTFFNPVLSSIFVSKGNSVTPFKVAVISLIVNIFLDPLLIFGLGPIPSFGVKGAAYATVFAQALAFTLYLMILIKSKSDLTRAKYFEFQKKNFVEIFTLGIPACLQSMVHALVGIVLNRYIASFGSNNIAVYSIGAQIESISWMSAEGYAIAVSAFVGQNFGAKFLERVYDGYKKSMMIMGVLGLFSTFLLFFLGGEIFSVFLPNDPETILKGKIYLQIISLSQFFMIAEIIISGVMNGLALTRYPAIVAVIFNLARIPIALILMPMIGVLGVWWAMSLSSILKGLGLYYFYKRIYRKTEGFSVNMKKYMSKNEI